MTAAANTTSSTTTTTPNPLSSSWHTREKSLLRELIILTMRHTNGDQIRFLPPLDDDNFYENKIPQSIPWGIRLHPQIQIVPPSNLSDNEEEYSQDLRFYASHPSLLKSGARDAISLCGQCGLLYSKIAHFVDATFESESCSVMRALSVRMEEEMEWYHGQLASLEGEFMSSTSLIGGEREMTLRTLVVRIPPIVSKLQSLAMVVEGVGTKNLRGGKLLSAVLTHAYDGTPRHCALVHSIAADVSKPWYELLFAWIKYGLLQDVHDEFFVREQLNVNNNNMSGYFLWHTRFVLVEGQIPNQIMTQDLAREVLLVGKGINFIRYCLFDTDWDVQNDEQNEQNDKQIDDTATTSDGDGNTQKKFDFVTLSDLEENEDEYRCISTLYETVTASSKKIHAHILDSLLNHHQLITHLHAIKRFLFLGQGDFVSSLVESLHKEFRGRTSTKGIYPHTLSAVLEGALRVSNARFLPDCVLARLGVKLLVEEGGTDGNTDRNWMGNRKDRDEELVLWEDKEETIDPWDYICLEYAIDSPLDAIVHTAAMESYHRVFMFLFRLKRVEWMLNNSWRQSTALNHAILIETKAGGADAPHISAAAEQSSFLLRRISSTRQTMLHFVSNLQNYLMFEVLEGGWEGLVQSVNKSQSLDGVVSAHDSYLNEILVKTLLNNKGGDGQQNNGKGKSLEDQLRRLLSIALKFGKFQDFIFGNSLAALNKSARTRRRVDETSRSGTWGRRTVDEEEGQVFIYLADSQLFQFVEKTSREFDRVLGALLKMLKKEVFEDGGDKDSNDESQPSLNHDALRFLLFRLDYSGYYHRQAKARSKKASTSA